MKCFVRYQVGTNVDWSVVHTNEIVDKVICVDYRDNGALVVKAGPQNDRVMDRGIYAPGVWKYVEIEE